MRYFLNISLIVIAFSGWCQSADTTTKVKDDSLLYRILPTGLRIGTDVISLGKSEFQNNFSGYEIAADIDFGRYYPVFEYGTWSRSYQSDAGPYSNDGTYWRAGVDVNFLLRDEERNMFFLGARYGRSTFSEVYQLSVYDSLWGGLNETYTNTNVEARWAELTAGIKVKIWKFIWMGYTGRFKFWLKTGDTPVMLPHDIPGYGNTARDTYWGFNYYIFVRIPFRKYPPLPPSKKKK